MKKIVVLFFLIILIIGHESIIFASYKNQETIEEEMKYYLQEVFEKRTEIWNDFMTGQYHSSQDIEDELKSYVADPLLTIDLQTFEEMLDNPTSYECIQEVNILNCQLLKSKGNNRTYLVQILWELQGFEDYSYEEVEYKVEIVKRDDNWLLSNYEVNR